MVESPVELPDEMELVGHHPGVRENPLCQAAVGLIEIRAHHLHPLALFEWYLGEISFQGPQAPIGEDVDDLFGHRIHQKTGVLAFALFQVLELIHRQNFRQGTSLLVDVAVCLSDDG